MRFPLLGSIENLPFIQRELPRKQQDSQLTVEQQDSKLTVAQQNSIKIFQQILAITENVDSALLFSDKRADIQPAPAQTTFLGSVLNWFKSGVPNRSKNQELAMKILDLPAYYTVSDLKEAYRRRSKLVHSDKFSGTRLENDDRAFLAVQAAYDYLNLLEAKNKPKT